MSLNEYIKDVKRDWNDKQWLEYCSVHMHKQVRGNYSDKTNKEDH